MVGVDVPILNLLVCVCGDFEEPDVPFCEHLAGAKKQQEDEDDEDDGVDYDISFEASTGFDYFGEDG